MKTCVRLSVLVLAAVSLFLACERESRPAGGASSSPLGSPEYTNAASVSAVKSVSYVTAVAPRPKGAPVAIDPAALYTQNCAACHQATGQGVPAVFPPLAKSPYVIGENVERMASIMLYGLIGPIKVLGQDYNSAMVGLGGTLSDEQLSAIAGYVRSNWGNEASPVGPEVFAAMREKWGTRGPFNIQELGEEG